MKKSASKTCSKCGKAKPATVKYFGRIGKNNNTLRGTCNKCRSKRSVELRKRSENAAKYKAYNKNYRQSRAGKACSLKARLKHKFGLIPAQYYQMLGDQNGVCLICGGININGKVLCVDHDHKTGKVRGLLCHGCNVAIGHIESKGYLLNKMLDYINRERIC